MESGAYGQGAESQESEDPAPGSSEGCYDMNVDSPHTSTANSSLITCPIARGIEAAKKKLRAFAIQKKAAVPPVALAKPVCTGNTTVLIGKLSSVKVTPKPQKPADDETKVPRPPKPGASKKQSNLNDSYTELQKKTLSEIEDMKRKMELVELGIPLGLVCPSTNALPVKAMPTKAMPPIKTFLDTAKIDEIIREARKAKAEGKEFKFDYQKFVPDYDNPFQRKKDHPELHPPDKGQLDKNEEDKLPKFDRDRHLDKDRFFGRDRRKSDRFDRKSTPRKDSKHSKYRERERHRDKDRKEGGRDKERDHRSRDRDDKHKKEDKSDKKDDIVKEDKKDSTTEPEKTSVTSQDQNIKEANVNLNDYLVCDSWSLDTEDKNSPQIQESTKKVVKKVDVTLDPLEQLRQSLGKKPASPQRIIGKLKPVVDSFKYEIDPNEDDDLLDIFADEPILEQHPKTNVLQDSTDSRDDTLLETIINEIKDENMTLDDEKCLVEYEESLSKELSVGSVTPELGSSVRSQRSDFSDGYKSTDSRKSTESSRSRESGYKSTESFKSDKVDMKYDEFKHDSQKDQACKTASKSSLKATEELKDIADETAKFDTSKYNESDSKTKGESSKDIASPEAEVAVSLDDSMPKDMVDSLETWSFVLKICQPLLFRHDKNKCYKETRASPKVWYTQNPKLCHCVKDRSVVYQELEMCKMDLVDRLYSCEQYTSSSECERSQAKSKNIRAKSKKYKRISDSPHQVCRTWYLPADKCLSAPESLQLTSEWDIDDGNSRPTRESMTPDKVEEVLLDREYQRFMEAVSWPQPQEPRSTPPTPTGQPHPRKGTAEERGLHTPRPEGKRAKLTSEGWSQESEVEEEYKVKHVKEKAKNKRKRKLSPPVPSSESAAEETPKKRKKTGKKKVSADVKKAKTKTKRKRIDKKILKKLKERKKKKKDKTEESEESEKAKLERELAALTTLAELEKKKKEKRSKKKRKQKLKKKTEKKKKRVKSTSSSSSSSDDSSSESSSESERKAKKKKKEQESRKKKKDKKKRKQSMSEAAQSEELFDLNIVANIKNEKLTDEELETTPVKKHREIVNVTQLHEHFSSSNVQVKQEQVADKSPQEEPPAPEPEKIQEVTEVIEVANEVDPRAELMNTFDLGDSEQFDEDKAEKVEFKEPKIPTPPLRTDDSSQTSQISQVSVTSQASQESQASQDSRVSQESRASQHSMASQHSRASQESQASQDSRASRASQESKASRESQSKEMNSERDDSHLRPPSANSNYSFNDVISKSMEHEAEAETEAETETEALASYEMYEQMAMAYQSDVATQQISPPHSLGEQRIETVVGSRGEIKCDWRASDGPPQPSERPSRWGLKPGEVNIVLTGGADGDIHPSPSHQQVYSIQSLANRGADSTLTYDEAYMDMYGDSDRLAYGDCFPQPGAGAGADTAPGGAPAQHRGSSLDDRINQALQHTVLGDVAKDENENDDTDTRDKGILVMKSLGSSRGTKRVSFADGYKPGQDSDAEEPPVKKRKKPRRVGCPWPCPAGHPDHVPLWDALPPPPPPASPPPPPAHLAPPPPLHLLRHGKHAMPLLPTPPHMQPMPHKFDPTSSIPNFMPPEPPPGLLPFP